MTQAHHTPGPWTANTAPLAPIITAGPKAIARSYQVGDDGAANARLIAAAPDLLAALQALLFAADSPALTEADRYMLSQPVEMARAAIAKATAQ